MKIPFNEAETMERLIIEERPSRDLFDRLARVEPNIRTAAAVAADYGKEVDDSLSEIKFSPVANQVFFSILGILLFLPFASLLFTFGSLSAKIGWALFLVFFVAVFLHQVLARSNNIRVVVSRAGLKMGDDFYTWAQVQEVYFIQRSVTNEAKLGLILALDNGLIEKYNVSATFGLNGTPEKLCAYIEHFRKGNS